MYVYIYIYIIVDLLGHEVAVLRLDGDEALRRGERVRGLEGGATKIHMRNLLGWLETRLAQNRLHYLIKAYITLT